MSDKTGNPFFDFSFCYLVETVGIFFWLEYCYWKRRPILTDRCTIRQSDIKCVRPSVSEGKPSRWTVDYNVVAPTGNRRTKCLS